MIDSELSAEEFIKLVKIFFAVSLSFAFLIVIIFHYYRNKYLTLTNK
jgi:hypothetical protein